jgi:hypothetical protein
MAETARYTTPDGKFTLAVVRGDDLIGFEEYSLAEFLSALFSDRLVMAHAGDTVRDVCITDDPEREQGSVRNGETLELRYWSGRSYRAGQQRVVGRRVRLAGTPRVPRSKTPR